MSELLDDDAYTPAVSRRRFLAGTGAATGLVWAAPVVTGLSSRAFAQGSEEPVNCSPLFSDSIQSEPESFDRSGMVGGLNVTAGNVDVVTNPGQFAALVPAGYHAGIDLDGSASATTVIESPGVPANGTYRITYVLSGDRRGNNNNEAVITFGFGDYTNDVALGSEDGPVTYSAVVDVDAGTQLVITHDSGGPDYIGMILLHVAIENCGSA